MYGQLQLGRIYHELGQLDKSHHILKPALEYAATKAYLKGFEREIVEIQLDIAKRQQDKAEELRLWRKVADLYAYTSITNGQEIIDKINWEAQKERIQWQLDTKKAKLEQSSLIKWIWAIVSIFLLSIILLSIKINRKRLKLQQLIFERKIFSFELDKVKSEKQLKDTHRSLASFQVYLKEKDRQIEQLEDEIHKVKNSTDNKLQDHRISLESLLDSHLMTDDSWIQFKEVFVTDKEELYLTILSALPGITESNLRIILLQHLGLSNQQVAHLLGITIDAVKKSKQRMRKKYGERFDEVTFTDETTVFVL